MHKRTGYSAYMRYYSSSAEALAPREAERRTPVRQRPAAPRRAARPAPASRYARPKPRRSVYRRNKRETFIYDQEVRNVRFFTWRLLFTLTLIFVGMVAMAMSSASLRQKQAGITAIRDELALLQEEEATLKQQIAEKYDVTQIEKIATARLNMSKPRAHQIVYIDAPKQDYVVIYGAKYEDDAPENIWEQIGQMIGGVKGTVLSIISD